MLHLSSQPPEIKAENLSPSPRSAGSAWAREKHDRWPTLQWPREVPLSGEPADVHDRISAYSAWLKTTSLPKAFY